MADQFFTYEVGGETRRLEIATDVEAVRLAAERPPGQDEAGWRPDASGRESTGSGLERDAYSVRSLSRPASAPQTRSRESAGHDDRGAALTPAGGQLAVFKAGGSYLIANDRIIVATRNNVDLDPAWLTAYELELIVRRKTYYVVRLKSGQDAFAAIAFLSKDERVSFAEPDFAIIRPSFGPGFAVFLNEAFDASVAAQSALVQTRCHEAWLTLDEVGRESVVTIAIIDDGVDTEHQDLKPAIDFGATRDFTGQPDLRSFDGHGTACAGLAAAAGSLNGIGVRGAGFDSRLCCAKIAWSDFEGAKWQTFSDWIATAICWAVDIPGVRVLSLSFGGSGEERVIRTALEKAEVRQVVVVAAAGNLGSGGVEFPARLPTVLAVGAVDTDNAPVSSSDWSSTPGPEVDIAAPGVAMMTTDRVGEAGYNAKNNYTRTFMGTSAATPIVAGVCALVIAANSSLTAEEVRDIVRSTAQPIDGLSAGQRNDAVGHGLVDALAAVTEAVSRRGNAVVAAASATSTSVFT